MPSDDDWMQLALDEAYLGIGKTAPNPPVGAVIVKDERLIGKGWHRAAGQPHAEREALANSLQTHGPEALKGATIYVTLEPCSTYGRTPPCTQGIIDAGITRVVYACVDKNPSHAGRADKLLESAGIAVRSGVLREAAEKILRPFFKVRETGLPWVIWKTAMSLDGRITRPPGEGQWLTGALARADVQKLRATVDAVVTSGETVRRDKPALTIRERNLLEGRSQPWRVVVTGFPDSLPRDAALFTDEWRERTLIRPRHELENTLAQLVSNQGILSVMIEAGGVLAAALLDAGLVDEAVLYYAPILCGGSTPSLAGKGWSEAIHLNEIEYLRLGDDVRMRGLILKSQQSSATLPRF